MRKIKKKGTMFSTETTRQVAEKILGEFDFIKDSQRVLEDHFPFYDLLEEEKYYILGEDGRFYKVTREQGIDAEVEGDLKSGVKVSFETAVNPKGKFLWAYKIKQID